MAAIQLFDLPAETSDAGDRITPFVIVREADDDKADQRITAGLMAFREQTGAHGLTVSPHLDEVPGLTPDHIAAVNARGDDSTPIYLRITPAFEPDTNPGVKAVAQARRELAAALNRTEDEDDD